MEILHPAVCDAQFHHRLELFCNYSFFGIREQHRCGPNLWPEALWGAALINAGDPQGVTGKLEVSANLLPNLGIG